jgi:hypothetical protein
MFGYSYDHIPRYEKQLENVEYLVLADIKKKNVSLSKEELFQVLEVLHTWRVID